MDVRWSSTFLMIDRVLELYPAIKKYATDNHNEIEDLLLSSTEILLLEEIHIFLGVFHQVQEIVCFEKTPSLAVVIPLYDMLVSILKDLKARLPRLASAIAASISKIEEYVSKAQTTRFYILAMAINPVIKFTKITSADELTKARKWLEDAMLAHQKAQRTLATNPSRDETPHHSINHAPPTQTASQAAKNLRSGLAKLTSLQRSLSNSSVESHISPTPNETSPPPLTPEEMEARDKSIVAAEAEKWLSTHIITDPEELDEFDLVEFWNSSEQRRAFPLIFKVAVDVMPTQASAVSCERAFSSAKETDTLRRSRLSSLTMEVLQFLKFTYRSERKGLSLMDHYIAKEEELVSLDADPRDLHKLVAAGREREIEALLDGTFGVGG